MTGVSITGVMSEDLFAAVTFGVALGFLYIGLFAVTLPKPEPEKDDRAEPMSEEEARRMIERMRESRRGGPGGR